MPMADLFSGNAFSMISLTDSINVVPNRYGRITQLGLFTPTPSITTTVAVERKNGVLNLLQTAARGGGRGTAAQQPKRDLRDFRIPHIPHTDYVTADDVQNIRRFGSEVQLEMLQEVVNDRLANMALKHDITYEHLLAGALRGQVTDADGTVLLNLFTEFGIVEYVHDFALSNTATDVPGRITALARYMDENLLGEVMSGVHVLVDSGFFDNLIKHPTVAEAYKYYSSTQEVLRNDVRRGFTWKGVTFEEYLGKATQLNEDNTTTLRRFIPANEGRAFPLGTTSTFRAYYGPSDFLSDVNMTPQPRYAKIIPDPSDRFVTLDTQQNPLPIVLRPQLLVRVTQS